MHKQCVPGSLFSAHTLEPGNEATSLTTDIFLRCHLRSIKVVSLLRYKQDDLTISFEQLSSLFITKFLHRRNFH